MAHAVVRRRSGDADGRCGRHAQNHAAHHAQLPRNRREKPDGDEPGVRDAHALEGRPLDVGRQREQRAGSSRC